MSVPDVVVRPAAAADRHHIWRLTRELAVSFVPQRQVFDASFAALLAAPGNLLLVADSPTQAVVGYVLASQHMTFFANGPVAWVEELIVDQQARNRGAGRALMSGVEDWARSLGAAYVSLATRRAATFYTAIGYEESAAFFRKLL
jgi:GNAT superfamily N-acetyltransferase